MHRDIQPPIEKDQTMTILYPLTDPATGNRDRDYIVQYDAAALVAPYVAFACGRDLGAFRSLPDATLKLVITRAVDKGRAVIREQRAGA